MSQVSFAQNFAWAKSMGGGGNFISDIGYSIAVDASGNVYTTGYFSKTVDFDPGPGTFNLTSADDGYTDIFVQKLDASGNFVWARKIGGASNDEGTSIAVDASGNVYVTGWFQLTADFDPGPGTFGLTSVGLSDIFVEKLDASGNFVWARKMGGNGLDKGKSIAVDISGNVYTTGYFTGTVDFDPGTGTFNLTSVSSSWDIFVEKLDASGNFVWARKIGETDYDEGYSITADASGNVYTTGYFTGTVDFDPGPGIFNLTSINRDVFVQKLDASGNFVWAKSMGEGGGDSGNSIAVDASTNVYLTGYFASDAFITKLDVNGNFTWFKTISGIRPYSIAVDAIGYVYTTGYFSGTADFDPGSGIFNLTSNGYDDIFIEKLDASGNFVWARKTGGTNNDVGYSIAVDASGNVYTTGTFKETVDFDSGTGTFNLTSNGDYDIFIQKLESSSCPTISISPSSLSNGVVGTAYNQTLTQTGLTGTPTWSVSAGTLPTGLSLNSTSGVISGTPTTTGTFNFTVQVTEGACSQTQAYSIVVSCPTITFVNTTATNATIGTAYSLDASVTSNTATVTYSVSPALPAGLSLNTSTGAITGIPTTTSTSTTYIVTASQSSGVCTATQNYTFAVVCPTITITPSAPSNGVVGSAYSQPISQTGLTGTPTWSISAGTLPTGLSLNSTSGVISGTPTALGTFNFTVQVTNGSCSQTQAYSIVVSCPTITFVNTVAPNGIVGSAYNLDASVIGNTATVTYSVSPALPSGLSLNISTGQITGTPTATAGSANYTVTAFQSSGVCTATQNYTFSVNCVGASISPTTLPNGFLSTAYSQTLTQTGLSGTPTWSVSVGTLPTGFSLNSSTGVISGTPSVTGTFNFTVQVTNGTCSATKTYTIEVIASGPIIQISVTDIDFGDVLVLQSSKKNITVKNMGTSPLSITSISMPHIVFSVESISGTIAPQESRNIEITFTPTALISYNGTVTVNSNATSGNQTFMVKGRGVNPTALNANQSFKVNVYPNPSEDFLEVSLENISSFEWKVIDMLGRTLLEGYEKNASTKLDISSFSKGKYLLWVHTSKGVFSTSFIKN